MKGPMKAVLGIVTSIGGFIEVGSLSTAAQAGALFRYQLIWSLVIATICLASLVEMSGRLAAISQHTLAAAIRERFGFRFHAFPIAAELLLDVLVLAAEIGGMGIALQLLTGSDFRWFIVPASLVILLLLWFGTFSKIESGAALLGLITLCFLVAAWRVHPQLRQVAQGIIPTLPHRDRATYGFIAVSILGATISPYMLNFYSSGAVEEKWSKKDLRSNRLVAGLGMGFGSLVSLAVLVTAAVTLAPQQIRVDNYQQAALMMVAPLGRWGVPLFAVSLLIGCFGAALEIALNVAYMLAQAFGWHWGGNHRPSDDARFSLAYCVILILAAPIALSGIEPLKLTLLAMALSVIVMPIVVFPFLVLLNDDQYVGKDKNGWLGNGVVLFTLILGFVVALIAIPLELIGG